MVLYFGGEIENGLYFGGEIENGLYFGCEIENGSILWLWDRKWIYSLVVR